MKERLEQRQRQTEVANYEQLKQLCEQIGDHYVGISNINAVAPIYKFKSEEEANKTKCPICFENLKMEGIIEKLFVIMKVISFVMIVYKNGYK